MTIARRVLISISLLLTTGLFIEVYLYHPAAVTARDPWAAVPIYWAAITVPVASFALFRPTRRGFAIFAILCSLGVLVGLIGLGFHLSLHAHAGVASLLSATTWLGDPPTLAPLEFLVASFFGLLAVTLAAAAEASASTFGRAFRIALGAASIVAFIAALAVAFGASRSPLAFVSILGLLCLAILFLSLDLLAALTARKKPAA